MLVVFSLHDFFSLCLFFFFSRIFFLSYTCFFCLTSATVLNTRFLMGVMGRDYRKLAIFQKAYDFVRECYPSAESLIPVEDREMYRQLRRALLSIPLNIAEGAGSRSQKVMRNHLGYAYGSCCEVEVLVLLCRDLAYMHDDVAEFLLSEVDALKAMIYSLIRRVEADINAGKDAFHYDTSSI